MSSYSYTISSSSIYTISIELGFNGHGVGLNAPNAGLWVK